MRAKRMEEEKAAAALRMQQAIPIQMNARHQSSSDQDLGEEYGEYERGNYQTYGATEIEKEIMMQFLDVDESHSSGFNVALGCDDDDDDDRCASPQARCAPDELSYRSAAPKMMRAAPKMFKESKNVESSVALMACFDDEDDLME